MDGGLGEGAEVPGGSAVMAAQRLAPVQPGQRAVQQRGAAHLAPCSEKTRRHVGHIPLPPWQSPPWGSRDVLPPPPPLVLPKERGKQGKLHLMRNSVPLLKLNFKSYKIMGGRSGPVEERVLGSGPSKRGASPVTRI